MSSGQLVLIHQTGSKCLLLVEVLLLFSFFLFTVLCDNFSQWRKRRTCCLILRSPSKPKSSYGTVRSPHPYRQRRALRSCIPLWPNPAGASAQLCDHLSTREEMVYVSSFWGRQKGLTAQQSRLGEIVLVLPLSRLLPEAWRGLQAHSHGAGAFRLLKDAKEVRVKKRVCGNNSQIWERSDEWTDSLWSDQGETCAFCSSCCC